MTVTLKDKLKFTKVHNLKNKFNILYNMKSLQECALDQIFEGRYEFTDKDLDELFDFFKDDDDFKQEYKHAKNPRYNSFEDSLDDFRTFLDSDVYADGDKNVHKFYILDGEDQGCSWMKLKSGKYANLDNLWMEYKSIVNDK